MQYIRLAGLVPKDTPLFVAQVFSPNNFVGGIDFVNLEMIFLNFYLQIWPPRGRYAVGVCTSLNEEESMDKLALHILAVIAQQRPVVW